MTDDRYEDALAQCDDDDADFAQRLTDLDRLIDRTPADTIRAFAAREDVRVRAGVQPAPLTTVTRDEQRAIRHLYGVRTGDVSQATRCLPDLFRFQGEGPAGGLEPATARPSTTRTSLPAASGCASPRRTT